MMIVDGVPTGVSHEPGWVVEYRDTLFTYQDGPLEKAPRCGVVALHVWQPRQRELMHRRYDDAHLIGFTLEYIWRVARWTIPGDVLEMEAWHDEIKTTRERSTTFMFEGFTFFETIKG